MTAAEWNGSHPHQCTAYVKAWETKREREQIAAASMKLLHCQIHGGKINNRRPRLDDFLPARKNAGKGNAALAKARAQVAAIQTAALAKRKKP